MECWRRRSLLRRQDARPGPDRADRIFLIDLIDALDDDRSEVGRALTQLPGRLVGL